MCECRFFFYLSNKAECLFIDVCLLNNDLLATYLSLIHILYGRTISSGNGASSLSAAYSSLGHGIYVVSLSGNKGNKKSYKISK